MSPAEIARLILMGLAQRTAIASLLVARGRRPETPAAIAFAASTDNAFTWTGTLDRLGSVRPGEVDRELSGTVVIGEVVALASVIGRLAVPLEPQVAWKHTQEAGAR